MSGDKLRRLSIGLMGGVLFAGLTGAGKVTFAIQDQEKAKTAAPTPDAQNTSPEKAAQSPEDPDSAALAKLKKLDNEEHYVEEEAAARALLAEVEARSGPDSLAAAKVLDFVVQALWPQGKATEPATKELAKRAIALKEKALGPDHPEVARSLMNLGRLLLEGAEYAEAKQVCERALRIEEKALGPEHPDVAQPLKILAFLCEDAGEYDAAISLHKRALAILERAFGPNDPNVAAEVSNLGNVLHNTGDFTGARTLCERALTIDMKARGLRHRAVADDMDNLGWVLVDIGDYSQAESLFQSALTTYERVLGPGRAYPLNGLAYVREGLGDYDGAKVYFEKSLAVLERQLGPNHPYVGLVLANLGEVQSRRGEDAAARVLLERALAIHDTARGADNPNSTGILGRLADALCNLGEYAQAEKYAERALLLTENSIGPGQPEDAEHLVRLARILPPMGESDRALTLALRAENISRDHLRLTAGTLPERQALSYASSRASGLDLALSTLVQRPANVAPWGKEVWDAVIGSRAMVLDEMAERHHTTAGATDPEIARLAKEFASARERLANLVVRGLGDLPPKRYRALLDKTRQEKEQAERALAEKSAPFREEQARSRLGFDDVLKALPSDSALVAIAHYGRYEFGLKPAGKPPEPVPSYIAFVLPKGEKEPQVVPLGSAQEIDGLVSRWREQMAQEGMAPGRSPKRGEAAYRTTATELRRKVWDPLAIHLRGAKQVFVVPDGALNLVSIAALPVEQASYLIERGPLIHYLSAERDLVPTGTRVQNEGLLAMGAPAFDETKLFAALAPKTLEPEASPPIQLAALHTFRGNRSACGEFQSLRFEPLPASALEAGEIVALWNRGDSLSRKDTQKLRGTSQAGSDGTIYLRGEEASEAAFKQDAPGKRVLHLATHGFFLGGHCASALEPSGKPASGAQPSAVAGENPLLLAGLALAGANHRQAAGPDEEDGVLTAEEIAALDLEGVEWAVLSACDTGIGEVKAGEGVLGLRRAFQVAGVRTVINSLWPVEDTATRQWMTALYRGRFLKGLSTAESVREASLGVLRERRAGGQSTHPFYWAGFVAAGDWQ